MTNRKIEYWVIPPESDAELVASMEEVLEISAMPYNPDRPVLCRDEQPVPLLTETRTPIPATAGHGKRVDYEYERAGTANIFRFTEPLAGGREVAVRESETKVDWAVERARILEGRYAHCEKVILVCDNLNTHTKGAFSEAFEPERVPPHPETGQLAQHRRERTEFSDAAVDLGKTVRGHPDAGGRILRLVERCQQHPTRSRLANESR